MKTSIESKVPLSESTYLILLSLAPGPRHGYAIMKDVATLSGDRVQFSTGTLYGALKRLLSEGYIRRVEKDPSSEPDAERSGRWRKTYVLTDLGRKLLEAEVTRLQSLVVAANLRILERPA
jgi:DNA-binding PadR family transcriptional regulator